MLKWHGWSIGTSRFDGSWDVPRLRVGIPNHLCDPQKLFLSLDAIVHVIWMSTKPPRYKNKIFYLGSLFF